MRVIPDNDDQPINRPALWTLVAGTIMWIAIGVMWIAIGLLLRWAV